jgi:hypothetical protein
MGVHKLSNKLKRGSTRAKRLKEGRCRVCGQHCDRARTAYDAHAATARAAYAEKQARQGMGYLMLQMCGAPDESMC